MSPPVGYSPSWTTFRLGTSFEQCSAMRWSVQKRESIIAGKVFEGDVGKMTCVWHVRTRV